MLKESSYPLKLVIEDAFQKSQILVFEVHLDSAESPQAQAMILSTAMASDGKTLKDRLSAEIYDLAKQKAEDLGLDIAMFHMFKPWTFTVAIMAAKLNELGFNPNYGIDRYFFNKAKELGKTIIGLETLEYQIHLIDSIATEQEDGFVRQALEELDVYDAELEFLVNAWDVGNIKDLERLIMESFEETPEIYQALVVNRNQNWLSRLETFLRRETDTMVIVGVGHLLGEDGLVLQLRRRGYTVNQL
jgi:uncharacterized protein YbaP (TraB family)